LAGSIPGAGAGSRPAVDGGVRGRARGGAIAGRRHGRGTAEGKGAELGGAAWRRGVEGFQGRGQRPSASARALAHGPVNAWRGARGTVPARQLGLSKVGEPGGPQVGEQLPKGNPVENKD